VCEKYGGGGGKTLGKKKIANRRLANNRIKKIRLQKKRELRRSRKNKGEGGEDKNQKRSGIPRMVVWGHPHLGGEF